MTGFTILVINPNNWYNKGDVTNRLGLVKALREAFGNDVNIVIESLTPRQDSQYFRKYDVDIVESILRVNTEMKFSHSLRIINAGKNAFFLLIGILVYQIFGITQNSSDNERTFLQILVNADLVISSPGGFLQDYDTISSLIPNLFIIALTKMVRKPIVIYSQSIGPFRNRVSRLISKLVLGRVDLMILREKLSEQYLKEANIQVQTFTTADATFSLEPPPYSRDEYRKELGRIASYESTSIFIGITIIGREYFLRQKREDLLVRYEQTLATTINYLIDRLNAVIFFIPQVSHQGERAVVSDIANLVNNSRVVILDDISSPEEVMKVVGSMDLLIGTRMHSNIFAFIMNIPAIAIAYEHKTHGIMKMLDLEKWVVDIESMHGDELISKINGIYKSYDEVREKISREVDDLRSRSLNTAAIVRSWYYSIYGRNSKKLSSVRGS